MAYPLHRPDQGVNPSPDFPALERQTLAYWDQDGTFQASVDARPTGRHSDNEFVFYDGPPFANGLPHYGHLLTGYVKDIVPRYETMRGKHVERRFGWDCHGLPAELEAERELGIKDKSEIDQMGVEAFNAACRSSVLRYTREWRDYVTRQARWVSFDHDYKTLDLTYMESVIWAFKTLWDKGYVYEGYRTLWYCFRCGTPLSASETKQDDAYRTRQDTAVTVAFKLTGERREVAKSYGSDDGTLPDAAQFRGVEALAWTTTPWTVPSNLALAVNPDVDYVIVRPETMPGSRVLMAEARLGAYARELGENPPVEARFKGRDLAGLVYQPPLDYFKDQEHAFRILLADYVTTEDGTGVVHQAPYGEEDQMVLEGAGIDLVTPVGPDGRFDAEVPDVQGLTVFEANKPLIKLMKERGVLLRQESFEHSYPHCWRCQTPLIQRPVSSWFVAVTKFRDRMVELNQGITWSPAHVRDGQFGKWLEGARDWCVSRNRYWGSPIPVWQSDNPDYPRTDVYGSLDELERDFGVRPTDLHRPAIDQLTRPNPDDPTGQSTMRRVPEVLDCWFDSGSMPFAQVHYPFENREWFEQHYPGDFIVEYIGQTRGWFYLLHVLATALFDRPSFKTCVTHGIVLGNDGTKMSKSRRNYPDVSEVFDRDGSDAMRWFLMSSPILHGGNLIVTEDGIRDAVRQVLLPLWNTWFFYALYSNAARGGEGLQGRRITAEDVPGLGEMDRYILARTRRLVSRLTELLDTFEIPDACEAVREYLDVLTNWYVRGSRDRFWKEDPAAFNTLYTVLETLCRAIAPLLPLVTEEMWRGLTGGRSVHLCDYPAVGDGAADDQALPDAPELVAAMDRVRHVVSAALGLRKARGLRVRQPLARLTVIDRAADRLAPFAPVIAGEVDVKAVDVVPLTEDAAARYGVREVLSVNARAAGPRLGRAVQGVIKAVKAGQWEVRDGQVVALTADGAVPLVEGEYTKRTEVEGASDAVAAAVLDADGFVVLDTQLTPELEAEGYARDMVRLVQDARKAAGLHVTDRIKLRLEVPAAHVADVEANRELVCAETLTVDFDLVAAAGDDPVAHVAAVAGPASAADKN